MQKPALVLALLCPLVAGAQTEAALKPGDTVNIAFSIKTDLLDGPYSVDRDGSIRLPFVGKVPITGKTLSESQQQISAAFIDNQIYTRLDVRISLANERYISIPNPDGTGTIRVQENAKPARPLGDFPLQKEKVTPLGEQARK